MTFVETNVTDNIAQTTRQRWSNIFVIVVAIISLFIAWNLRTATLNATTTYINNEVGITATYPRNWLLDEASNDYVFRVRNLQQTGFSTTYLVSVRPIGEDTSRRTLVDSLAIERAQTRAAYRTLSVSPFVLGDDAEATETTYTFVDTNANPFLEVIPTVVIGVDVLSIQRGQAIIITMLSEADQFDNNRMSFAQFVNTLAF